MVKIANCIIETDGKLSFRGHFTVNIKAVKNLWDYEGFDKFLPGRKGHEIL